ALTIGDDARWFQVGAGEKVDLSKRRAPRLILLALLEHRGKNRGVTLEEIIAAGWPGERIQPEAAAARAYTAIKTLRARALRDVLARAERVLTELRFDPKTFLERFAPAHDRGLLVRPHRALRERAQSLRDLRRARESFALRYDLVREADAMGFLGGDE